MPVGVVPLVLGAAALLYYFAAKSKRHPPGPRPLPIIGNLLQMPKDYEWKTFAEWTKAQFGPKKYGDCVYVQILGQPIVILGSLSAAHDLLSQRSAIYSSRPRLVMAGELAGFAQAMPLMPYSSHFNALRRLIHKELTGTVLQKYWSLHEDESRLLMDKVLASPDEFLDSIRHYSGSVILRVTYGYQTASKNDKFLVLAERVTRAFSSAAKPGAWAVDILPWLRHLPSWLPGTGFKRVAAQWNRMHLDVVQGPYDWALENQDSLDLIRPNFVSTMLSQSVDPLIQNERELLLWASGSLFGGGADTTVAAISSFFLAMALFPEVQSAAQAEIDRVIPTGRLPELADRPNLPYVECVMRETLRWNPIVPLGLPHMSVKDDVYGSYHIPAGSIIMVNIWSILRDPAVFPDPVEFRPERFLNNTRARDVTSSVFGFGRRSCPGIHFAEASMFIAIATALSRCTISNATDGQGHAIGKDVEYRTGTLSHPKPFRCEISPRARSSGM
ncbi:cytochrome P450 [Roridomyces roridus]|uniref:Cytochrome P450 n=1 Tax=Roridomyces roridus TaxID=1738132 RepID=A0AAD7BRU7_9AGAR|nr:cytochrome P450 [Roridomyces roridus]